MEGRYKATVSILFRLTDAAVVVAAWLAAYWARFFLPSIVVAPELPPFRLYASLVPPVALVWIVVFSYAGVYESGRLRGRKGEVMLIWRAHFVAFLLFVVIAYSYDAYRYSRLVMFYFGALGAIALAVFRVTLRTGLRHLRARGRNLCRVLVVGGGSSAMKLIERFRWYPELGMKVAGVLTQYGKPTEELEGAPVLGSFLDLAEVVARERPQQVLIALPPQQQFEIYGLLGRLGDSMVKVRIVPDFDAYATFDCRIEHFEGMPVIRLNDSPIDDLAWVLKRAIDIVVSGLGLVFLSPVLLFIAALVRLTSHGPVLYAQERMGLDGRTFPMYKFRSMRSDAEAHSGAVWARRGDDRRTPIGGLLRKSSLDELPQLWNVFVGQMSLVGPRPERPVFVQEFRQRIPAYMLRHKVKSGITGWAQVNGWRGDTSLIERTACDLYYIQHWSLDLDIKILIMTLWRGFINKNAY